MMAAEERIRLATGTAASSGPAAPGPQPPTDDADEVHASLYPVDLGPVLDGTVTQPVPDMVLRDDGAGLFYAGSVNGLHGDSGVGKGWVVAYAIRENAKRGKRTLILDFEDIAQSAVARLIAIGLTAADILSWVEYVRPEVPLGPRAVAHFCELIRRRNIALTVIDSLGEAFATEGVDENKDVEVGPWFRRVARPLADTGTTLLLVDHSTKATDNALHPSGSKRKRAAITGASYLLEAVQPFVKGADGRLRLTCAKDRHGNYRRAAPVADLVMTTAAVGVNLTLYAPAPRGEGEGAGVDIELAARAAVKAVAEEGRPLSRVALEGLMKVKARATVKRGGIDLAVARGLLVETTGPRNARLYAQAEEVAAA